MTQRLKSSQYWVRQRSHELLVVLFVALLPLGEAIHLPIFILLIITVIAIARKKVGWHGMVPIYTLACALLILPMVFSILVAMNMHDLIQEIIRWSVYMLACLALLIRFRDHIYEKVLLYGIAGVLFFWTADALIQYIFGQNIFGFPYNGRRLTGIFHPDLRIGNMLAHWSPFLLEAIRRFSLGKRSRLWAWLLVLPFLAVIIFSGSRSAWLVMLVALPLYVGFLLYRGHISWRFVGIAVIALVGSMAAAVQSSPEVASRFDRSMGIFSSDVDLLNQASSNRIDVWQTSWLVFQDSPIIGIGKGSLRLRGEARPDIQGRVFDHSHFFGLDVLLHTGVIGFSAYVVFLFILIRQLLANLRRKADFAVVTSISVILMTMPINVHWGFYSLRAGTLMIVMLGLAFAATEYYRRSQSEGSSHR